MEERKELWTIQGVRWGDRFDEAFNARHRYESRREAEEKWEDIKKGRTHSDIEKLKYMVLSKEIWFDGEYDSTVTLDIYNF